VRRSGRHEGLYYASFASGALAVALSLGVVELVLVELRVPWVPPVEAAVALCAAAAYVVAARCLVIFWRLPAEERNAGLVRGAPSNAWFALRLGSAVAILSSAVFLLLLLSLRR
jgi:hypothetical protein